MNERVKEWRAIEGETAELLALARAHEWETLVSRQARRQARLVAFFAEPMDDALTDVVRAGVEVIRRTDDRIGALIRDRRVVAEDDMSRFRASKRAVHMYAATP